jgi:poly(hydroxyalkanoate) depolymerase family esterase
MFVMVITLCMLFSLIPLASTEAASVVTVTGFGSNPGNLVMKKYVPDNLPAGAPLVVAMHGCAGTGEFMAGGPGWSHLADIYGFALALPEQKRANNASLCFNWFNAPDQSRTGGEAESIKQMVDYMRTTHAVDPERIFVTGMSAGGCMTNVMMAAYPDVFKAGASLAGAQYKYQVGSVVSTCGTNATCWGNLVRNANPSYSGPWPRVSIWQGTADTTTPPARALEMILQWTNVHGIDQTADVNDTVKGFPHAVYKDSSNNAKVEYFELTDMAHKVPIDPGSGIDQCGTVATYVDDMHICSAYYITRWFGINPTTPPNTLTFNNDDATDGYVLATNSSGAGATVGTGTNLGIGRDSAAKYNRTVLSFNTSGIPAGANISRAYLRVSHASTSGNPFANNTLFLDVNTGCFGACSIEASDWTASATASGADSIPLFPSGSSSNGGKNNFGQSNSFNAAGIAAINRTGNTQVKLRFSNFPTSTAIEYIKPGASSKLTVEY